MNGFRMTKLEGMLACAALTGALVYAPAQRTLHALNPDILPKAKTFVLAQMLQPSAPTDRAIEARASKLPVQIFAAVEPAFPAGPELPVVAAPGVPDVPFTLTPCQRARALQNQKLQHELKRMSFELKHQQLGLAYLQSVKFGEKQRRFAIQQLRVATANLHTLSE
jgi:hypothetical protein